MGPETMVAAPWQARDKGGMSAPHLFCFGLGYCAQALCLTLKARGIAVSGTVRSADKAAALRERGIAAQLFAEAAIPAEATHLLISVPPGAEGDPVLARHGAMLKARAQQFAWAGYLSTTGVYGDRSGGLVDEESALLPSGARGRARVEAERDWRETGLPLHIFRLAGIYGPERNQLAALKTGTAKRIDKPGQIFSRIHVDDIVAVLAASIAKPNPGRIYNVCDDEPANPADVTAFAATLLGVEPPPLVPLGEAGLSALGRSFYEDSKRVSNARIKTELGVTLRYPSYKEGLKALL
jgi:nucleoside-diphosphate-sugar epimerase